MAKAKKQTIDLGACQEVLEQATLLLNKATREKLRADQAYEQALASHEQARIDFNNAALSVRAATSVPNPRAA